MGNPRSLWDNEKFRVIVNSIGRGILEKADGRDNMGAIRWSEPHGLGYPDMSDFLRDLVDDVEFKKRKQTRKESAK